MFGLGAATTTIDFLPSEDARGWLAEGLAGHTTRLGAPAQHPRVVLVPTTVPRDLDALFELVCSTQAEVGQADVELSVVELENGPAQDLPPGFSALGNPTGQLLHTFHRAGTYALVFLPTVFRVKALLLGSVARELGRIAIHRAGGHEPALEPDDWEADAELAGIALGLGPWVANGAYVFDNASCKGGGCGIDLGSVRAGLSMPEACFALALDTQRKGIRPRAVARELDANQRAAFKVGVRQCKKQPALAAGSVRPAVLEGT